MQRRTSRIVAAALAMMTVLAAARAESAGRTDPVRTPDCLRQAIEQVEASSAVVLQVEREGQLTYVAFERQ